MEIKELILKSGNDFSIVPKKINVFVGPNNSGKSLTLNEILKAFQNKQLMPSMKLLKRLELDVSSIQTKDELQRYLRVSPDPNNPDVVNLRGSFPGLSDLAMNKNNFEQAVERNNTDEILTHFGKFLVTPLNTEQRLSLVKFCPSIDEGIDPPQTLLQLLQIEEDDEVEKLLNKAFKGCFDHEVRFDVSALKNLYLRVSRSFEELPSDRRVCNRILSKHNKIEDEGDGFRSFLTTILGSVISKDRIILIDEPETSLHPPQAYFLGNWFAKNQKLFKGQIFISTHDSNFLSGLLSEVSDIQVFRLSRDEDCTSYKELNSELLSKLTTDPLLSNQRIIEGIFYKGVVVCEADADRVLYQAYTRKHFAVNEVLFTHALSKQTLHKVVSILTEAGVKVCSIADIDILNGEGNSDLIDLLKAHGSNKDFNVIRAKLGEIRAELDQKSDEAVVEEAIASLKELIEAEINGSAELRRALERISKKASKWADLKKFGVKAASPTLKLILEILIKEAKKDNHFIVPVGELEGWFELETSKKNRWIIKALAHIEQGNESEELHKFIEEILKNLGFESGEDNES